MGPRCDHSGHFHLRGSSQVLSRVTGRVPNAIMTPRHLLSPCTCFIGDATKEEEQSRFTRVYIFASWLSCLSSKHLLNISSFIFPTTQTPINIQPLPFKNHNCYTIHTSTPQSTRSASFNFGSTVSTIKSSTYIHPAVAREEYRTSCRRTVTKRPPMP